MHICYYCSVKPFCYRLAVACALLLSFCLNGQSRHTGDPVASFHFDNNSPFDETGNYKAKLEGTRFTEDRFDNPGNAVFLFGNENSYINLGTDSALKTREASISVWFRATGKVWSGCGYTVNPIILTKNTNGDDFFESYGLYFDPLTDYIVLNCSRDSLKQIVISTRKPVEPFAWHHVVISFDYSSVAMYVDGTLEGRQVKNFETKYLPGDSVLLGVTANKKNNRFFSGVIDDLKLYDRVLGPEEVLALYNAPNPNKSRNLLNKVLLINGILLFLLAIFVVARLRIIRIQKREKEKLELMNKLLETELRVNRALMNPHFVYNSLYSIQSLILNKEIEQANTYLVKFSRLLRKTLEGNLSDTISLETEIDLLSQFIEIENLKFEGTLHSSVRLNGFPFPAQVYIPVLMIQPFVENAIWHGLKNKTGEKTISISFNAVHEKFLECIIEDNGVGRRVKEAPATGNKSLAIGFIGARLALINKIYGLNCNLKITDKPESSGTIVTILVPVFSRENARILNPYPVQ